MMKFSKIVIGAGLVLFGVSVTTAALAIRDEREKNDELISILRDIYPDVSPDGKTIAFHSNRASFSSASGDSAQIFTMDLETKKVRQLTNGPGRNGDPVWSPDGTKIMYSVGDSEIRDIVIMDADGSSKRKITTGGFAHYHGTWLPDGTGIIFDSNMHHDFDNQIINREIYTMDLNGGNIQRLTDYDDWDTFASVSPDGSKIVWRRVVENFETTRNAEIFVMDRDGLNVTRLTHSDAFDSYPAWSPDGSKIVFSSNRDGDHYEDFNIYMINPDGGELQKITETIHGVEQIRARFMPDGERIIYNRQYPDGRIEIRIMDLPE